MQLRKICRNIRDNTERHGLACALIDVALRTANRLVFFKILKGQYITIPDPAYLQKEERYSYRFLDRWRLMSFADDPRYELADDFLKRALERDDECFGILDGDVLASYGWYSRQPDQICPDLRLDFSGRYVYMYRGFTHPAYRGQRLHAIGMTMALHEYRRRGFEGLVSYVEANNFSSLKSVHRMGYRNFGDIYVARILGRYLVYCTSECEKYGFRLVDTTRD